MVEPKEYWANKAEEYKKAGKFEDAVQALDKLKEIEKEEKQDDFWYQKAIQYSEIGDYEKAKESLYKDLEVGNKTYDHFFFLGKILHFLKKDEESLECLNKASEEQARKQMRNTLKVDQMKNVRKFEDAVKYSDQTRQENRLNSDYWHLKGLVLFNLRKFQESSSCFETALQTDKNNQNILYEWAKSELGKGNKPKSLEILKQICSKDPDLKERVLEDQDFYKLKSEKEFREFFGMLTG